MLGRNRQVPGAGYKYWVRDKTYKAVLLGQTELTFMTDLLRVQTWDEETSGKNVFVKLEVSG